MSTKEKTTYYQAIIFLLAMIAGLLGVLLPSIYGPSLNTISTAERAGQDGFTVLLCLGMAIFCFTQWAKSIQGRIILTGGLLYITYIYAWFSFGLVYSPIYPLYIFLFGASVFLTGKEIKTLLKETSNQNGQPGYPLKTAAIVSIVSVTGIGLAEILILIDYISEGGKNLNPYDVFIVLDLALVFPAIVIIAFAALLKKPKALLLQTIALTKIVKVLPGLIAGDLMNFLIDGSFKDPVFMTACIIISLFVLILLIKALQSFVNDNRSIMPAK